MKLSTRSVFAPTVLCFVFCLWGTLSTAAPTITSQPTSRTASSGNGVSFAVAATGSGTLSYQWRRNNAALANSTFVSGVTAATLNLSSPQTSDNGTYTVVVTDSADAANPTTSADATLTITDDPPVILAQTPGIVRISDGGDTRIFANLAGSTPLTMQWRRNGVALSGPLSGTSVGAVDMFGVAANRMGNYQLEVTNAYGSVVSDPISIVAGSYDPLYFWNYSHPYPQGNQLNAVAFGPGRAYAVGNGGTLLTSTDDGATWQSAGGQFPRTAASLNSVVYDAASSLFIIGGGFTQLFTVPVTGGALTDRTPAPPANESYPGIAFGGGRHVAVGGNFSVRPISSAVRWSGDNGATWHQSLPGSSGYVLNSVAFGAGRFVAVGSGGNYVIQSTDGDTWNNTTLDVGITAAFQRIVFDNNRFIAVGDGGNIYTSDDGINFTKRTSGITQSIRGIARVSGSGATARWAAVTASPASTLAKLLTSSDNGVTWTNADVPNTINQALQDIQLNADGSKVFIVGQNGRIFRATDVASLDVADFSPVSGSIQSDYTNFFNDVVWDDATSQFITVAGVGNIHTSPDGWVWTSRLVNGSMGFIGGIARFGSKLVAVGSGSNITTSTDGQTWGAPVAIGTSTQLRAVAANATRAVAVGDSGRIFTSLDGTTWSNPSSGTSSKLNAVAEGGGRFVAVGGNDNGGTSLVILVSDDGATWTPRTPAGMTGQLWGVSYGDGVWIACGSNNINGGDPFFLHSFDNGETWSRANEPSVSFLYRVKFFRGAWYAVGSPSMLLIARDGGGDWVPHPLPARPATSTMRGIAFKGSGKSRGVIVGNESTVLVSNEEGDFAPTILAQPASAVTAVVGGRVDSLKVEAANAINATYQWRKNGVNIPGATAAQLSLENLQIADSGTYDVVVTNGAGFTATSQPSRVVVVTPANDAFPNFAWRNPLPAGGTLQAVIYAQGKFVAAGRGGRVIASTDGTAWTSAATVPSEVVYGLAHDGANFVAVGGSGRVYTSADLASWTLKTTTTNSRWLYAVTAADNRLVAVGDSGEIVVSADGGATWAERSSPVSVTLRGVAGTTGHYVAVGANGAILTSTDTTAWAQVPAPTGYTSTQFNAVAFVNGQFVAVGSGGAVLTSVDGAAWTPITTGFGDWNTGVIYDGSAYVVVTGYNAVLRSTNLSSWIRQDIPVTRNGAGFNGAASHSGLVVLAGVGGEIFTTADSGVTWTARGAQGGMSEVNEVQFADDQFIAVGSSGAVLVSDDARSWWQVPSGTGNWLKGLAFGKGRFVVATAFGDIVSTSDGVVWQTIPVGDNLQNNGIIFHQNQFLVAAANGRIRRSSDGINWTTTQIGSETASLRSIAALGNRIVVVGDNGRIYFSTDGGGTWTQRSLNGATTGLRRVRVIDNMFVAVGDNRTVGVSLDGDTWRVIGVPNDYNTYGWGYADVAKGTDGYYVVSSQGKILRTSNLSTWAAVAQVPFQNDLLSIAIHNDTVVVGGEGGALLSSKISALPATPTVVTGLPAQVPFAINSSVSLSVFVASASPLTFEWKKDGVIIPGATGPFLNLTSLQSGGAGTYSVIATAEGGQTASSSTQLTVAGVPTGSGPFYALGDLPGGMTNSQVRDATKAGGVIHAVGSGSGSSGASLDTAFLWTSSAGFAVLPNLVGSSSGTNPLIASAITRDGAYIASRARANAGTLRQAVRVTTNGLTNLNLGNLGGFTNYSAAVALSDDGSVLYGFAVNGANQSQSVRFTASGPTATAIPFLNVGDTESFPAARGASADGSVLVGNSYVYATTQGGFAVAGNNAYRYVQGTGISALPKLAGGTWNGALAVSADGNLTLVAGNSPAAPNGAIYLHNASAGTVTLLGTPNSAWVPGSFGGLSGDGAVAVVNYGAALNNSSTTYFHNAHGWFQLVSALVALGGVDLSGWQDLTALGLSRDGTLVFGSGQHNGNPEGFVVEFPAGFLANYNPTPAAPANTSIVGVWTAGDTTTDGAVVAFLADGTYFHLQNASAEDEASGGADGFERGLYTWNAATGALKVTTLQDTNGDIGLSDGNGSVATAVVSGNTLTFTPPGESSVVLTRVTAAPLSIAGGWVVDDPGEPVQTIAIFLPNGYYYIADDGDADAGGHPGIEHGTYVWNDATHALSVTPLIDTNGDWGLSHPTGPVTFVMAANMRTATYADSLEAVALNRIFDPAATLPAITTQPSGQTSPAGSTVALGVAVSNPTGVSYQWFKDGNPLAGQTSATLTLNNLQAGDAGSYTVLAVGPAGASLSSAATITIGSFQGTLYGVGDLPGGAFVSEIRDATKAGGVIYAVGGSAGNPPPQAPATPSFDTAVLWTSTAGLSALPNLVTNTTATNPVMAGAITRDAAFIASRARAAAPGGLRHAVRVTRSGLTNLSFGSVAGASTYSAATGISNDGSILTGFATNGAGFLQAARYTAAGPGMTLIPLLSGDDNSSPAGRGVSADGAVVVGTSDNSVQSQFAWAVPGNKAFRYVHGSGTTAIPMPAGGTWSGALAVTPDGNLTLVAGDSAAAPNGEAYVHNAGTGQLTSLGTPNSAWTPSNFGGLTADGTVALVAFWSQVSDSNAAYFHNSHGWFQLRSALFTLPGIDLTGWDLNQVFGISPDGTLIFGGGNHSGNYEGFVIELPAGFLAGFNPQPVAPANTSIVGVWTLGDTTADGAVVAFLADGTYFHIQNANAEEEANGGADGFERGLYTWNAATGAFTAMTLQDTNGDIGLSGGNGQAGATVSISGNTLTFTPVGESPVQLTRVTAALQSLSGGWAVDDGGGPVQTIAVFLPNGYYYLADDGVADTGGRPGIEHGTYAWNAATQAFSATPLIDTNGDWGLSHPSGVPHLYLDADLRKLTFADDEDVASLARIVDPAAPVPVISAQPATQTVANGAAVNLSVGLADATGVSYQWRRNGVAIAGATGATYTISSARRDASDRYDIVVANANGASVSAPAILSVAPTAYPGILGPDLSFNPAPLTISTRIFAAIPLPDGKWMVGGEFVRWDSTPRTFLARLNSDFSLDTGFIPPLINNIVYALARDSVGRIYVGGDFTAVDGHKVPGLFRLKPDGTFDLAWRPHDNPPSAAVTAFGIDAMDRVLVARQASGNGQVQVVGTAVLRRLTIDGEHDTSFAVDLGATGGRINVIVTEPDNDVVFAGALASVAGVSRNGMARVSSTGVLDPAFGGANSQVFALVPLSGGRYLVGGGFTLAAGSSRNRAAIINADGSLAAFNPPSLNGNVLGAAFIPAAGADPETVVLNGTFTTAGGAASHGIVRLKTSDGTVDKLYVAPGGATSFATLTASRTQMVYAMSDKSLAVFGSFQAIFNARRVGLAVIDANGNLAASPSALLYRPSYTGSAYTLPGGQSVVFGSIEDATGATGTLHEAVRFNDNGSIDPTFPQGTGYELNGLSTFGIYRTVRQSDGKFLAVGDLAGYNGNARTRMLRIAADGTFDPSFNPGTGPGIVSPQSLALAGGRTLLWSNVAYNGNPAQLLVRINADGTFDRTFALGAFAPGSAGITVAAEQADGRLLVAGNFTTYAGTTVPGLMRLMPDGSLDNSFQPGTAAPGQIVNIVPLANGRLVLTGGFTTFAGSSANHVVVLMPGGSVDGTFNADPVLDATVTQVLPQEDGKLIIGGDFAATPSPYVARLNGNGALDTGFALHGVTGGFGQNARFMMADDGTIYAFNQLFSVNNGVPVAFMRFRGAPVAPSIAVDPVGGTLAEGAPATLFVRAGGTGPFTYQWRHNGSPIPDATDSVLATGGITVADAGDYDVVVTGPTGASATSAVAHIAINANAPVITNQPYSRTVPAGSKVIFRVTATGSGTLTYQWRRNGTDITGATAPDYVIDGVTAAQTGNYTVVVGNSGTTLPSATAVLTVLPTDNVLWQQFNDYTQNVSPGRLFHDGAGKFYATWTVYDTGPDMAAGRFAGALARFDENTGAYDPTFKLDRRYRRVMHMDRQPDGKLLLAVSVGDATTVIRVSDTGTVDPTFSAPFFARSIRFITRQGDGKVLVAATDILSVNAPAGALGAAAPSVYRLNTDGAIDGGFTPAVLNDFGNLFAPPTVDGSGNIYLAGGFSSINSTSRTNIARLGAAGALDAFASVLPAGFASNQARGIGFQSDGRAVVVGDFRHAARGSSGDPIMAIRFNTDGSFDGAFAQPLRSEVGLATGRLRYLVVQPDDKIVGASGRLVRLNANGSVDTGFVSRPLERESFWVTRDAAGRLYVPDQSAVGGNNGALLPVWNSGIARFAADGTPDFNFQIGGFGQSATADSGVVLSTGEVLVAGAFNRFGSVAVSGVARFTSPTALAGAQIPAPSGSPANFGAVPYATIAPAAAAGTYVASVLGNGAGSFYANLRRVNADGTTDPNFTPALPAGYDLSTAQLFASPSLDGLLLAQPFVSAQAALNGSTGDGLLRLNADGSRDNGFSPPLTSFATVDRDGSNAITLIRTGGLNVAQVLGDGRVLVIASGVDGSVRLLRLLSTGALDGSFNTPLLGTIAPSSGFTGIIDDPVTSTTDQFPLAVYGASDLARTAVQLPDGRVYVGGRLALGGSPKGLVRLNANGAIDSSFTGAGIAYAKNDASPYVTALTVDSLGRVYVAGRFDSYNGTPVPGLLRLLPDGTFDTGWQPGFGILDAPYAAARMTVSGNKLYVFGTAGNTGDSLPAPYRVADIATANPLILMQPHATAIPENGTALLSVAASGVGTLGYQWSRNGTPISGATGSTLLVDATDPNVAGSYTVLITSSSGDTTSAAAVVTVVPSAPAFAPAGNIGRNFGSVVPAGTSDYLFVVPSAGTRPIAYQWRFNGVDIPGATGETYFLQNWQPANAGAYSVRATNSLGTVTSPADQFFVASEGGWTWRNPLPTGNGLTRVAVVNGQFMAGGLRGTLLTSSDGLTWTQRTVPAANNLFAFQFANGRYVAMGSLNAIFTSPDGAVWTPRSTGIDGGLSQLQDMTFGGGKLLAVGTGGVTALSVDGGLTWTPGAIGGGIDETLIGLTYTLNKFWAIGTESGRVYSTADGLVWNSSTTPAATLRNLTYGASRLVAVGPAGIVVTSTDGTTWTQAVSGTTADLIGVNFVNNRFIAVGALGTILTSADGVAWTARSSGGNQSLLQGTAFNAGRYVIVGQAGNTGRTLLTSTDSIAWNSLITGPRQGTNFLGLAASGSAVVAVGAQGAILSSVDGVAWTERVSGTASNLNDVAYGGGKFLAVGGGSVVVASADGASWTVQTTTGLGGAALNGVRYDGAQWIAVGDGGGIYTSSNGTSWTFHSAMLTTSLRKLAFGGGAYVAVGGSGNIVTSNDAATWAPSLLGDGTILNDVAYGGGLFVAVGNSGRVYTSTNGGDWTAVAFTTDQLNSVNYIRGHFVVTGTRHQYYVSANGVDWTGRFSGSYDHLLDTVEFNNRVVAAGNFGSILTAGAPVIAGPLSQTVTTGQSLVLKAAVSNSALPVTYVWTKDSTPVPDSNTPILVIPSASAGTAGSYVLSATNAFGTTDSSPVAVALNVGVQITSSPSPQTVIAGSSANFSVTATGTPAPTYQWRLNGADIPDATSSTLTLNNLTVAQSGPVTVVVANAVGSVTSDPVQLTVNPAAPVIVSPLTATAVANVPFSYRIATNQTSATFGAAPLPAGLAVDTSTGVIGGTPTQTGLTNVTLTAGNVSGTDTKVLQINVLPPPPVITSSGSGSGRVGVLFSYTITATNAPTTFTATGLPDGLSLTGAAIGGTPAVAGSFVVTITAQNATGQNSVALNLVIAPPLNAPVFTGSTSIAGTAGSSFSYTPNFGSGVVSYALVNRPGGAPSVLPANIALNPTTGVISGNTTEVGVYEIALQATNSGGATTTAVLTLTFNPAPTAPKFTSASSAIATAGAPFSFALTTSPAATSFAASGLPAGLSLNTGTGAISGTPTEPGLSVAGIAATNANGVSVGTLSVMVNSSPDAPVITSSPIVVGRVGTPLNVQLAATNSPDSFVVVSGSLPAGVALSGAGLIGNAPTAAGETHVWVAASKTGIGRGPALELIFFIDRALNVPVITSNGTASGQVGQSFQYQIAATNAPTSFGTTTLPAGLSLNSSTGVISGLPSSETASPYNVLLTASNGDGASAPKILAITIAAPPATPRITSASSAGGRVGVGFSYRIAATELPTLFAATGLPPGLSVDTTTGLISGTPTASSVYHAAIRAGNAAGLGQSFDLTITIAPPLTAPAITSSPSAAGKVGVLFNYAITATGSPTSFGLLGTLPDGLALNTATGLISGNPADAPGVYVVGVTASNSAGTSQPQLLVINIDPADNTPVITSAGSASATVGTAFAYQITATNVPDTTPFPPSVFLDAVGLPPGLAVNPSTGLIGGTPTTVGTYFVSLVGVNQNGTGLPRVLAITVSPAPNAPVVNSAPSVAAQVGVAFTYGITATNLPTSFEALDVPAWLSVNTATGVLAGIPTEPGTILVQLQATNAGGTSAPANLTIAVAAAANTPVVNSLRTASAQVGAGFSYSITATNTPTSFLATGLPPGLSLNTATGQITGTPTVSGTFSVLISGRNANGQGQPVVLTITIAPSLQIIAG